MRRTYTEKPKRPFSWPLLLLLLALAVSAALLPTARLRQPPAGRPEPTPAVELTPAPEPEPTPCPHEWQDGVCTLCGERCPHEWRDGVCALCGETCPHEWQDGVCAHCGETCPHEWQDGVCALCGKTCPHEWQDGVCTLCGETCPHEWQDGVCALCGETCPHEWQGGVCALCGETCPHKTHNEDDARCSVCGEQFCHHYERGVCTVCGRKPLVYTETLPDEYYRKSEQPGTHRRESYSYRKTSYPLAIWLPHDYSEDVKYNVILLMPGDKSLYNTWIDADLTAPGGGLYYMSDVYDHIAEEHLCDPFIVVGISNFAGMDESVAGRWICEGILPYIADNYSTWAEDGKAASLKAAREHFAIGGLSRGSIQTYDIGMCWCLDYFANFACFSNMSNADPVAGCLNNDRNRYRSILCYYATWGARDKKDYRERQEEGFHFIVDNVARLTEGKNAFGQEINGDHNWNTWSTSFFDAIQYLF